MRATRLQEVASDAAALVDSSIPLLDTAALVDDIKIGLTINPLAKCELDHCVANNPSPHFSLAPTGLLLLNRRVYVPTTDPIEVTSALEPYRRSTTIQQPAISASTKPWSSYDATMFGPACASIAKSTSLSACSALTTNRRATAPTDSFSLFRFQSVHGTPSAWTLSSNFRPLTDIQPFSSLSINYRRKAYSSPQQTASRL